MTVDTNAVPAFDTLPTPAERDYFRQEYLRLRPSVVIADYAWMAPIFDEMPPGPALKVIMTHDVLHERVMTFARHGIESGHAAWTWDSERALLRKAQVLLAVQDTEAEVVQAMAPEADVISTPYAVRPRPVTALPVPGRCLFVGSHSPHNVQGLFWFLTEAWPGILRACPHVSLHACGSVCDGIVDSYANVQKLGRVEDLAAEYGSAEVCLVPLQVGSGLKIKLVEALAYGRPSVATSIGLQGLRQFAGRAVVEADTAADFGEAVIALLTDPERRRQLEQEARVLAATWLSPERCYQPFVNRIRWHNEHGLGSN